MEPQERLFSPVVSDNRDVAPGESVTPLEFDALASATSSHLGHFTEVSPLPHTWSLRAGCDMFLEFSVPGHEVHARIG